MDVFTLSLSASLLILAIIVTRAFFIHKLPKKTFLILWGIALCRLLQPLSIPSRFNIWSMIDMLRGALSKEISLPATAPLTGILDNTAPDTMPIRVAETMLTEPVRIVDSTANTGMPLLFWLWLTGLCLCALYFLITHLLCCRNVYQTALPPPENRFVKSWLDAHPTRRKLCIKQSDKVTSPLTFGILKPVILLPKTTNWRDETLLSYILTHEYVHIKQFDILWKWVLTAAVTLHWFNPLIWLMYILANRDLELSCDETVVRICGENTRSGYALTLIGLAEKRSLFPPLCNNFSKNSIEERILSIMKMKKASSIGMLASVVVVFGIGAIFVTSAAPATMAASSVNHVSSKGYVERMLFVTSGEAGLKVTYDGKTWETYSPNLEKEVWRWYSYEEFKEYTDNQIKALNLSSRNMGSNTKATMVYKELTNLTQTLTDIKNGIKVSKDKTIYELTDSGPPSSYGDKEIKWRCFGYTFKDKFGREVDLGLFETRDELFAALKQYYAKEVAAGSLPQAEADSLFNQTAHSIRNNDEVPLLDKLLHNVY